MPSAAQPLPPRRPHQCWRWCLLTFTVLLLLHEWGRPLIQSGLMHLLVLLLLLMVVLLLLLMHSPQAAIGQLLTLPLLLM